MKDLRILVIEDEILIGLDVVSELEEAGFGHVQHAAGEAEALELLNAESWNAVVADANLNGRSIERIAQRMQERSLPFCIVSGYERGSLPAVIGDAPLLGKPVSYFRLVDTVRQLCGVS